MRFANFRFSVPSISGPLRKHIFTYSSSKGQGLWFVIGGFQTICLFHVSRFVALWSSCFGPNNRLVKFALKIFFIFLTSCQSSVCLLLSTKNPLTNAISFSEKPGEHFTLWFALLKPAFTRMVDRTDKPKIPSKFAIRAAQYNEFRCNQFHDTAPLNSGAFDWHYLRWSTIPFFKHHSLDPDFQCCSKNLQ